MKKRRKMNPEGKRKAVMAVGEQLFAANGYTNTSMAEIAREADVAVGTLYRLFPDKPSLLAALHEAMEDSFIEAMTVGWHQEDAYEKRFYPMLRALFSQAHKIREIMPLYAMTRDMIGAADYQPGVRMIQSIEIMYAQGIAAGAYHKMPDGLVGPLAHAMVEGGMRAFLTHPTQKRQRQIVEEMTAIFRRSFVAT